MNSPRGGYPSTPTSYNMPFSYPYRFVQNFHEREGHLKSKRLYSFVSEKSHLCYWVWVEEYDYNIYAIKFHLKQHRFSPNKYSFKTNTFEPRVIVQTCINIMIDIYHENDLASFGFIGSNSEGEPTEMTKRFRFYRAIMATYFSDKHFEHIEITDKSTYMMVNKVELENDPDLIAKIQEAFIEQYPYFE